MCYQHYPLANAKFIPVSRYILCVQLQGQSPRHLSRKAGHGPLTRAVGACTRVKYTAKFQIQAPQRCKSRLPWLNILAMLSARSFRSTAAWHAALSTQQERPFFFSKVLTCTLGATDSKQSYRLHRHRFPRHVFQTPTSYDTTL